MVAMEAVMAAVRRVKDSTKRTEDYPPGADVEVARVVADYGLDEGHLERAAQMLLETCTWTPVAAEWLRALEASRTAGGGGSDFVAMGCPACEWTGYRVRERGGYTFAAPCACFKEGRITKREDLVVG